MDHETAPATSAFRLEEALALLSATPRMLDAWLRGLPAPWLIANEGGDTWNAVDVTAHLIQAERTNWLPRVATLLELGESSPFMPFARVGPLHGSSAASLPQLLDEFSRSRRASIAALRDLALDDAALRRTGMHPALGPVTLEQLLSAWVVHDLDHVTQIARVMALRYATSVGPWRQFLRVLSGNQG